MNPGTTVVAAVGASAAVAFVLVMLTRPEPAPPPPATVGAKELAELSDAVGELRERLGAIESRPESVAVREAVADDLDARIEAAVARALAAAGGTDEQAVEVDIEAAVVELAELGVNDGGSAGLWSRIRAAGKVDEVIAAFRRRAAENPGSADAQADLADAILSKVIHSDNPMEQAQHSIAADAALDKALELDPTHWRARFTKAVSYSYWPPITGKPAEAMKHFETLIEQQEARPDPQHDGYSESYVALGNLYSQQGNAEKAREVWERGLTHHPGNQDLKSKLER